MASDYVLYAVEKLSQGLRWRECEQIVERRLERIREKQEKDDALFRDFVKTHFSKVKE